MQNKSIEEFRRKNELAITKMPEIRRNLVNELLDELSVFALPKTTPKETPKAKEEIKKVEEKPDEIIVIDDLSDDAIDDLFN